MYAWVKSKVYGKSNFNLVNQPVLTIQYSLTHTPAVPPPPPITPPNWSVQVESITECVGCT